MPSHRKAASKPEAGILNDCLLALSQAGCLVWRQNTGVLMDRNGRPIRFGLCVGSSDIIGLCADGTFLAIECKTALGQPTEAQLKFLAAVKRQGGRSGIARSADDALQIAKPKT